MLPPKAVVSMESRSTNEDNKMDDHINTSLSFDPFPKGPGLLHPETTMISSYSLCPTYMI
jgi:hypothetical protein